MRTRGEQLLVLLGRAGLLIALTGVAISCRNGSAPEEIDLRGRAMGATWRVVLVVAPGVVDRSALQSEVIALFEELESEMSHWREDSVVSRFNRAFPGDPVAISPTLAAVILEARRLHELTDGALDITLLPLIEVWGFGPAGGRGKPPRDEEIAEALRRVGIDHLSIDRLPGGGFTLTKTKPGLQIDLSSVGKGFAIDRIAERLERLRHESYLIEFGGELRARGVNAAGRAWRVGLERPDPDLLGVIRRRVALEGKAIATSGDYRLFFRDPAASDRSYSHIIDPRTGRPVTHALTSVSVIAASAAPADGLATALMVLGPDRGFELAISRGLAAAFVMRTASGLEERSTPAFRAAGIEGGP